MQDILNQFTIMPAITVMVFLLGELIKNLFPTIKRFLPAISCVLGLIIALLCSFFIPEALPNTDLLSSLACGVVSGFAATGAHQLKKTVSASDENNDMEE